MGFQASKSTWICWERLDWIVLAGWTTSRIQQNYLPCIVKLMQGRSTVELLIIRFGIEGVQGLAMVEEDYLSYVINRPR